MKTKQKEALTIEWPAKGEIVGSAFYEIEVVDGSAAKVELSIDGSAWNPCRFSNGHWNYSWTDYRSGDHEIRAQAVDRDGQVCACQARKVKVLFSGVV
jgi:hypothetical protein